MLTVYVVSDATGETAERLARSALVQFSEADANVIRRGEVRTAEQVFAVVREASGGNSLILHTIVSDEIRRAMLAQARQHGVDAMDLMGPVLDRLSSHLKLTPQEKPGLFKQLAEARSREIEAVDFAFRHDDGLKAEELDQAEVILVGVSRSMKTPTMLYLAYRGWLAANVPLVPGLPLPPKLLRCPRDRVFCLFLAPERLMELRLVRAKQVSIPEDTYSSREQIAKELLHSHRVCLEHGWRSLDVTNKSVEEASLEIITLLGEH